MKKIILAAALLMAITACSNGITGQAVNNPDDSTPKTDGKPDMVVQNDEGVMTANKGSGGWCDEGADWSWMAPGEGSAQWEVKGIVSTGEYAGLCHIEYKMQSSEGETRMDYYINENQDKGYYEMTLPDGQTIKQQWTG